MYLRNYLLKSGFPEAYDDLLLSTRAERAYDVLIDNLRNGLGFSNANELALNALCEGFSLSHHDFIKDLLEDEFFDHIDTSDMSLEYWTGILLEELSEELKGVNLSPEYLDTDEGAMFHLTVIGRISLFFEEYGL